MGDLEGIVLLLATPIAVTTGIGLGIGAIAGHENIGAGVGAAVGAGFLLSTCIYARYKLAHLPANNPADSKSSDEDYQDNSVSGRNSVYTGGASP